ncbi:MAG: hypothetical protein Q8L48_43410 [Archangium sp.]|nr:hypothetical protein [Archangium sp.]
MAGLLPPLVLALALATLLSQAPPLVAVIDISSEDAIYEDISRRYAQSLVEALTKEGVSAVRVDESDLPEEGCRLGPCLGVAAREKGALAVVTLDAEEVSKTKSKVVVTVMRATNGEPLAGGRYELTVGMKKIPKGLTTFLASVKKAMGKVMTKVEGKP